MLPDAGSHPQLRGWWSGTVAGPDGRRPERPGCPGNARATRRRCCDQGAAGSRIRQGQGHQAAQGPWLWAALCRQPGSAAVCVGGGHLSGSPHSCDVAQLPCVAFACISRHLGSYFKAFIELFAGRPLQGFEAAAAAVQRRLAERESSVTVREVACCSVEARLAHRSSQLEEWESRLRARAGALEQVQASLQVCHWFSCTPSLLTSSLAIAVGPPAPVLRRPCWLSASTAQHTPAGCPGA